MTHCYKAVFQIWLWPVNDCFFYFFMSTFLEIVKGLWVYRKTFVDAQKHTHVFSKTVLSFICFQSYLCLHLPGTQRTKRNQRSGWRQRPDGGEGECGRRGWGRQTWFMTLTWMDLWVSLFHCQGVDGVPGNGTVGCHGFQVCAAVGLSYVWHRF